MKTIHDLPKSLDVMDRKKQRLWFCIFRHSAVKSVWICVWTKNPRKYKRTLWLFNIDMENGPFIDGLPSYKMVIFHGYVSHNQMVYEHTMAHIPSPSPVWPSTQGPSTHPSTQILRRCHGFQNAICGSSSNGPRTAGNPWDPWASHLPQKKQVHWRT